MSAAVIDVRSAEDVRDVVHRTVQALAEGQLVAFPTETVYGVAASALDADAVKRLAEVKGRAADHPMALAVKSADEAFDYVPDISPLGRRLARRCWPGPVTLVLGNNHPDSLIQRLPTQVHEFIIPRGTLGLRVPAHPLILDVLQLMAGPLALTSANLTGEPDAVSAEDVIQSLGDRINLILDDGRSQFAQSSSVILVHDRQVNVLREGVVSEAAIKRLARFLVLMVCTGNTCRSPMAELLMRRRLANHLGCQIDQLDEQGVQVMSAGIAAMPGGRPSIEAVNVMLERELDLSPHLSQPLSAHLARHADLILTMTQSHRDLVVNQLPEAENRVRLLRADQGDISDPIGGSIDVYRQCADQIDAQIEIQIRQMNLESLIGEFRSQ